MRAGEFEAHRRARYDISWFQEPLWVSAFHLAKAVRLLVEKISLRAERSRGTITENSQVWAKPGSVVFIKVSD